MMMMTLRLQGGDATVLEASAAMVDIALDGDLSDWGCYRRTLFPCSACGPYPLLFIRRVAWGVVCAAV